MDEQYFDIKNWVKKYFGLNASDKTLDNTNNSLEFIWVWSIFEHKYLKDSRTHKSYNDQLFELSSIFPLDRIDVDTVYGFLHNRYYQKGKTTRFFKNLNFETKWQRLTIEILKKQCPTKEEKLQFTFLVLYKFRCNLFHGRKDSLLCKNYNKVFYQLIKFLSEFLDSKWTQ